MRSLHSIGKYPERYDKSNQAAMEHGSRMRHQSKNPEYVAKLGVNNGVKGSGNPYIDQDLSTGNETILVGKQVILRCHIEDVKGKSVRKCNSYHIQLIKHPILRIPNIFLFTL